MTETNYTSSRIAQLAIAERPQERLESNGAESLSDAELLAVLLRTGTQKQDILQLCRRIIAEAGSLSGLLAFDLQRFREFDGIGLVKGLQLIALVEMARRILSQGPTVKPLLDTPEKVFHWLRPRLHGLDVERFWVLCLNRKNRLIAARAVTSGTATASLVHPREVYREAIRHNSAAILCAHNHPSGDPAPSAADIQVTRELRKAGETLQIDCLDHIIIGQTEHDPRGIGYYSFNESGLI
ncbi:MAG: DNA repair protein RadC [Opitutales bacterium]|nr:DNA repair protein RadC [Opitutales bacterium]